MIIKSKRNVTLSDIKIITPIGGSITLGINSNKTLKIVYEFGEEKTVYILHETKLKKLILTK